MEQNPTTRAPQKRANIPDIIKIARQAATPLIGISTPDQVGMVRQVAQSYNGESPPILMWSNSTGIVGVNKSGQEAATLVNNGKPHQLVQLPQLAKALQYEDSLRMQKTLVFVINAHLAINERDPMSQSCITMARDELAARGQTIVFLAPVIEMPAALCHDVMILDDPLPGTDEIREYIGEISSGLAQAEIIKVLPTTEQTDRGVDALRGLSAFECAQALSMSMIDKEILDAAALQERRNAMINNVPGLRVDPQRFTYDDIRGIARARWFAERLFNGPEAPSVILRIDEIEKKMSSGTHNEDHEGGATKGDELQVILTSMEDNNWTGCIAYGHPGTAKTMWTEATGPTHNAQTITLDIAATRAKYVGESEQNIRAAMRVVKSIGGDRVYVMATCNELDSLKPELKRRFTDGVFFFDLPTENELETLWGLYRERYNVPKTDDEGNAIPNPPSRGWTGAEVRNACRLAYRLRISLAEAATEIIPVIHTDPQGIKRRREKADGKFKSASSPGAYKNDDGKSATRGSSIRLLPRSRSGRLRPRHRP